MEAPKADEKLLELYRLGARGIDANKFERRPDYNEQYGQE